MQHTDQDRPLPHVALPSSFPDQRTRVLATIWHASGNGDVEQLERLCSDNALDDSIATNAKSRKRLLRKHREHAFSAAAEYESVASLEYLYTLGCEPSIWEFENALKHERQTVVDAFLEHGFDVDQWGLLQNAVSDQSMLDRLLDLGADPNACTTDWRRRPGNGFFIHDDQSDSPLEAAVRKSVYAVKRLIERGANPLIGNPLHIAAALSAQQKDPSETKAILELLIASGCDVDAHDTRHWRRVKGRPLHWAAMVQGTEQNIKLLIEHGALVDARNAEGFMPLDMAKFWNNDSDKVAYLLKHKAVGADQQLSHLSSQQYALNGYLPIAWPNGSEPQWPDFELREKAFTRAWFLWKWHGLVRKLTFGWCAIEARPGLLDPKADDPIYVIELKATLSELAELKKLAELNKCPKKASRE